LELLYGGGAKSVGQEPLAWVVLLLGK
jgi:hypothetical protein